MEQFVGVPFPAISLVRALSWAGAEYFVDLKVIHQVRSLSDRRGELQGGADGSTVRDGGRGRPDAMLGGNEREHHVCK